MVLKTWLLLWTFLGAVQPALTALTSGLSVHPWNCLTQSWSENEIHIPLSLYLPKSLQRGGSGREDLKSF